MSIADELASLESQHARGALSDEEYAAAKARVLAEEKTTSSNQDANQWGMWIHFSLLAGYILPLAGFVVPIVLWQSKKDESPIIDAHGKIAMNAILTWFIYMCVGTVLAFVLIGIPLLIGLAVVAVIFPILGGIKASDGEVWSYPFLIRFF